MALYLYEYEILGGFFAPSKLFTSNTILTEDELLKHISKMLPHLTVKRTTTPFDLIINDKRVRVTNKEVRPC